MCKKLNVLWQHLLPKRLLSALIGRLANSHWRWLKSALIFIFIKCYKIDLSLAEKTKISDYKTLNEFFIRKLKAGVRTIDKQGNSIVSPVDGCISQLGNIQEDQIFQAKNFYYDLNSLLANISYATHFQNGKFITLYLSPRDCHRVYMPFTGQLLEMKYVPGKLFSVNPRSVNSISKLFSRNERMISIFETKFGYMAVVMVGAMLVRGIRTVWAGKICPNVKPAIESVKYHNQSFELAKGDELGNFEFGSTVIILLDYQANMAWDAQFQPRTGVQIGQRLAVFN